MRSVKQLAILLRAGHAGLKHRSCRAPQVRQVPQFASLAGRGWLNQVRATFDAELLHEL